MSNWPYPRIVAHRGGGKLAPENTLAAIDVGARYGHNLTQSYRKMARSSCSMTTISNVPATAGALRAS